MSRYQSQIRAVIFTIFLGLGAYILGNILVLIAAQILSLLGVSIRNPVVQLGLSVIILQGITFGGFALAYLKFGKKELTFIDFRIPNLKDLALAFLGLITLLILLSIFSTIISVLGIESARNVIIEIGKNNPSIFLVLIPLSFILIGPGEELLFRGIIQGILREHFNIHRAIILASIIFSFIHVFSLTGPGKIIHVFVIFLLAIILGIAYEYTENIVIPALIHGAFNAIQFGAAYYILTRGIKMSVYINI